MENKKDIIFEIKKRRLAGLTDEQIKATLINMGFVEEEINSKIEESYNLPDPSPEELVDTDNKKEKPKKRWWWPF